MDSKTLSVGSLPMNFKISLDARVRAAAGVPAYMRRKRRIEDLEEALRQALTEVYQEALEEREGDEAAARAVMVETAKAMDLGLLNDLIERHNKWYPIEANLPTDPQTNEFMIVGRPWASEEPRTWRDFVDVEGSGKG